MSKIGIELKINVNLIEKARLYPGQKGNYLTLTGFIDLDQKDQYENNGFLTQSISKEERDSGVKMPILGNTKIFFDDRQPAAPRQVVQQPQGQPQYQQAPQRPAPPMNQPMGAHQQAPVDDFDSESIPF